MITLIAEVIIGIFISNFKSEDHPYLLNFFKGITIGLIGYILGNLVGYIENNEVMEYSKQIVFFIATQTIGFFCFIFLLIVDFLNSNHHRH